MILLCKIHLSLRGGCPLSGCGRVCVANARGNILTTLIRHSSHFVQCLTRGDDKMEWGLVIRRNTGELLQLVSLMLASLGSGVVSRGLHLSVLRRLRAVEAAFRRLVVVAARDVSVRVVLRDAPVGGILCGQGSSARMPLVPLFDPRKRFGLSRGWSRAAPQLTVLDVDEWQVRVVPDARPLNPERLQRRLSALQAGLADLPKQALRLARWRARRDLRVAAAKKVGPFSPMRPGWPPGYRVDRQEVVHEILDDLDLLARRIENGAVAA